MANAAPHFDRDVSGHARLAMFDPDAAALTLPMVDATGGDRCVE
jgi:hypothetical protein